MLPIKKIYIDSRFKSSDSISDSDMKIDLPASFTFQEDTVAYITDISIPVSWYSIQERNNKFYFQLNLINYVRTIEPSNYSTSTLNFLLVKILNEIMPDTFKSVTDIGKNEIGIAVIYDYNVSFKILTDVEAKEHFTSPLNSINGYLMNYEPNIYYLNNPYMSGYVNLNPIRNIYLTSGNLGSYNTINLAGNHSIKKKFQSEQIRMKLYSMMLF